MTKGRIDHSYHGEVLIGFYVPLVHNLKALPLPTGRRSSPQLESSQTLSN